mgnify:FL=1
MAVIDQRHDARFALFHGDACEVLPSLPDGSVHLSLYSPPFARKEGGALYTYSSSPRDLSNARTLDEFLAHYGFIVADLHRMTMPGRLTAVHVADVPTGNTGRDGLFDLPGEVIRLHEALGFQYVARYTIWKEPLAVRNRTMAKNLAHKSIVEDSSLCGNAGADYLLVFRKGGENPAPIAHPTGLDSYAGACPIPPELHRFRGWTGDQKANRYSHWIWRRYASSVWDDIRVDRVLPFREARDEEDEKHVHPLQLDVVERACVLFSNPGETVVTPFMGVGSEVFGAIQCGRRGVGVELKDSYYRQAVRNLEAVDRPVTERGESQRGFDFDGETEEMDAAGAVAP